MNCWQNNTYYYVLTTLLDDLRVLHTDIRDTSYKLNRLARHLGRKPFLVVLDEIDKPAPPERNRILYNLTSLDNLGLICIGLSQYTLFAAENRVTYPQGQHADQNAARVDFIGRMIQAGNLTVRVALGQGSEVVAEYNLRGLADAIKPLRDSCGLTS